MNHRYITNAVWAPTGQAIDLKLGRTDSPTTLFLGDIPLPDVCAVKPAGSMNIPAGAEMRDAGSKLLLPALFDMHAKIEISGLTKRESITRAGQAAQQGGVGAMLVIPTANFTFDNSNALDSFREMVYRYSAVEMHPAGCITQGMGGEQQAPYNTLAARGISVLSDAEHVPSNVLTLHRAMRYAAELGLTFAIRGDVPLLTEKTYANPGPTAYRLGLHGTPPCAEEIGLETIIRLAADAGAKLHVQTVSTAGGVEIIRRAKAAGCALTAEVALHHLLYTDECIGDYDTTYKVLPPLRTQADCNALLSGVKDGTIDCIVSDHTPCLPFAKKQDFISAPQGMVALDHMLPVLYTALVKPGKLSWSELISACCTKPAAIAGEPVPGLLLFDPKASTLVCAETLPCGTLNTPLLGKRVCGAVAMPL